MVELPTLYEHYTSGGITSGLSTDQPYFTLNNKNISLYSGALHYFRVPQEYWRDRLRKMRAAGLNAVETYIPWNLHEPSPGSYDFGAGGTDFQEFLNVEKFLRLAQEEDLLAIVRPGPFISAEFEFGGLPAWLIREKGIRIRSSDEVFVGYVEKFFTALFSILTALQFTVGGPIIAFQIENEFANAASNPDLNYLQKLKSVLEDNGVVELMFTADNPERWSNGAIPGVLQTGNFGDHPKDHLNQMSKIQPGKPLMVMEYWTGWFDVWATPHETKPSGGVVDEIEAIITYPSSFNLYMFHGGTSFGFLSGGTLESVSTNNAGLQPLISSYDYDAPLSEAGDYTYKYYGIKRLLEVYNEVKTKVPDMPNAPEIVKYDDVYIVGELPMSEMIENTQLVYSELLVSMENLDINNKGGQSYGYVTYRKTNLNIPVNAVLEIEGRVCDTVMVLINGRLVSKVLNNADDFNGFGYWRMKDSKLTIPNQYRNATLDLVVANLGRDHWGYVQPKGLSEGNVTLNGNVLLDWQIAPLEFKKDWFKSLKGWREPTFENSPALYRAILNVSDPKDTFIDMREWSQGFTAVNGFVISRHLKLGPQQTEYLPAPLLVEGENEIIIFEHFAPAKTVKFSSEHIYGDESFL